MAERPEISPALLAEAVDAAPRRLQRKLDRSPTLSEGWTWHRDGATTTVLTDKGETVSLQGASLSAMDQVTCTCLLAPRCLHILATLHGLPLRSATPKEEADTEGVSAQVEPGVDVRAVTDAEREAAKVVLEVCGQILGQGLRASGLVVQADLLRAIHGARVAGLHRAAMAGLRVVSAARSLRGGDGSFAAAAVLADFHDLLNSAWQALNSSTLTDDARGMTRRRYEPVKLTRLNGICCEVVTTRSGYQGLTTWLIAPDGQCWTLNQVTPRGLTGSSPLEAYRSSVALGGCLATHKEICREGLLLSNATGSHDHRLGRNATVQAARAACDPAEAWRLLNGHVATLAGPVGLELQVVGALEDALLLMTGGGHMLRVVPALQAEASLERDNLKTLAKAPGTVLEAVVMPRNGKVPVARLLAVRGEGLKLPEGWRGLVNIGLDRLEPEHLPGSKLHPVDVAEPEREPAPLFGPTRHLTRALLGGVGSLGRASSVKRDVEALREMMMPQGAALMMALRDSAAKGRSDLSGRLTSVNAEAPAMAWLALSTWVRASAEHLRQTAWARLLKAR